MSSSSPSGSSRRSTTFSPMQRRQHRDTEVDVAVAAAVDEPRLDAAVLRQPLLGDVEARHDLHARDDRVAILQRRRHDRLQLAVDAEPDPHLFLVRLDVDVARALLNGRQHQRVDELDDWRLAALPLERRASSPRRRPTTSRSCRRCRVPRAHGCESAAWAVAVGRSGRFRRSTAPTRRESRLGRHDRLDVQPRHELDVVHDEHVRRIRHRERQGVPDRPTGSTLYLAALSAEMRRTTAGIEIELGEGRSPARRTAG